MKNRRRVLLQSVQFITAAVFLANAATAIVAKEPSGVETVAAIEKTLAEAISRAEKSVVAVARVRKEQPGDTFQFETRRDAFNRHPTPMAAPQPTDPDFIPNEYAAGVVIDRAGLILTAADVLADQSDYYVTTSDRKIHHATIKASDPRSNLAVLSIDAADLSPIPFKNATELRKGQIVISLGNPYAIARDGQPSAAWGIVSNLARKAPTAPTESDPSGRPTLHHYGTLIQTDAKLNRGTSGGPLLNVKGEMVGLCVAIVAAPGYESAAGYAIPVDQTFRRAVDTLSLGREVEYGFLGVQPANLGPQELHEGLQGMRVGQIIPGAPAAKHGLRPGDIITAVDDAPIFDADGLVLGVGKLPAGAIAKLSVLRDNSPQTVNVTLAKYAVRGLKIVTSPAPDWRGLRVDYRTAVVEDETRRRAPEPPPEDAVIVVESAAGSPAHEAGLRCGMLISGVDGSPVSAPKDFFAAVARNPGPVRIRLAGDAINSVKIVRPER